jgi:hypothetical protein
VTTVGHGSLFAFGRKGICGLRVSARTTTLSAVGHAVEEEAAVGRRRLERRCCVYGQTRVRDLRLRLLRALQRGVQPRVALRVPLALLCVRCV